MQKLDKGNIRDILALTPMQQGMLYHYLKNPNSPYYFEQLSLDIRGEIRLNLFEKAWDFVVDANEMLRTVFRWEKVERPIQIILEQYKLLHNFYDFSKNEPGEKNKLVQEIKEKDRKESFDLRQVPFRLTLCKIEPCRYEMIISNYHILYDGWSNGIILKEFFKVYKALSDNFKNLASLPGSSRKTGFKEFVKWVQNQDKNQQKKFWKSYLNGFDTPSELSIKRKTTSGKTNHENLPVRFEKKRKDELEDFVKRHKITLATVFCSAWGVLLQRYNNCRDVVFGTTVAGRSANLPDIKNIVGLFINTIPLRVQSLSREKTRDFLHRIHINLQSREPYEHTSLVQINETNENDNASELFDTVLVVENYPLDRQLMSENHLLSVNSYSMVENTHYPLTIIIKVFNDIEFTFIYHKESFNKSTIKRLTGHFTRIVINMIENPSQNISRLEIISREEKQQLIYEFNGTCTDFPRDKTITKLFEEQMEKTPDNTAVLGFMNLWGHCDAHITYKEIYEKSSQLAHILIEKGIQSDTIAAVMVKRSIEMILGILGILKAGGAYLPIDPDFPEERVRYILNDSHAKILLTQQEILEFSSAKKLNIHPENTSFHLHPSPPPPTTSLAYVIYTSGSTGKPKGVMVEQSSVVNLLFAMQKQYPLKKKDTYLLKTSYLFDVSVTELFGWFPGGGRLAVPEPGSEKDPNMIADAIKQWEITHINFVPSMFTAFVDILNSRNIRQLVSLKYIFLAGEALSPEIVKRFKRLDTAIALENIYGPTEAAVYSSWFSLANWNNSDSIPIGKPLPNILLFILGKYDHLQPIEVPGELCISGSGLARGYLNRAQLTVEKFCLRQPGGLFSRKPVVPPPGPAIFRKSFLLTEMSDGLLCYLGIYFTGDLARWQHDGNIEFLGRIDSQVKIRGFRIELGEIQNQLLSHQHIKEAVVTAGPDNTGQNTIYAYIVPERKNYVDISLLKKYLQEKLPEYMVPAMFVLLEKIPLTPTGKIDRLSLPKPEMTSTAKYIPPRDYKEKILTTIWSRILGIKKEQIGIDDNFFDLGGHSLKSTALVSQIHKQLNVNIPISLLFKIPDIRGLAAYIKNATEDKFLSIQPVENKEYYHVSSAQKRMYVLQQIDQLGFAYNIPTLWKLEGHIEKSRVEKIFIELIRRHESLRTSFHLVNNIPVQKIHEKVDIKIEYNELTENNEKLQVGKIIKRFIRKLPLEKAPLMRAGLIKSPGNESILIIDIHHIISDGTTINVLLKEFLSLLKGNTLPFPGIQYKDYSQWHNLEKQKESWKIQETYWLKQYKDDIPVLNMPLDFPRPPNHNFQGDIIYFCLDQDLTDKIRSFARKKEITIFMLLLTVCYVVLSKYTRQEDIIIGFPVTGRKHPDVQETLGMFVNMLPMRNRPGKNKTFDRFLSEVKENVLDALENQDYQFEELVEKLEIERVPGRNPLFDVVFELQTVENNSHENKNLELSPYVGDNMISKFDLLLGGKELDNTIKMHLYYLTVLYKKTSAEKIVNRFTEILTQVLEDSSVKLEDLRVCFDLLTVKPGAFAEDTMDDFEF